MSIDPDDFKPWTYCRRCRAAIFDSFYPWQTPSCEQCDDAVDAEAAEAEDQ